jgi:hypothetical protein
MAASAGGRGRLRASDADRDQVVDALKAAFVQGRLAKDEFGPRVGRVLAARTYAELDSLTADIPAGLPLQGQPAAMGVQLHRQSIVARKPPSSPSDRRGAAALALIAQVAWTRRRLMLLVAGMLLLVAGAALPSPVAFISGLLVVGSLAPQALASSPEAATVRTWQWLNRDQASHL